MDIVVLLIFSALCNAAVLALIKQFVATFAIAVSVVAVDISSAAAVVAVAVAAICNAVTGSDLCAIITHSMYRAGSVTMSWLLDFMPCIE